MDASISDSYIIKPNGKPDINDPNCIHVDYCECNNINRYIKIYNKITYIRQWMRRNIIYNYYVSVN